MSKAEAGIGNGVLLPHRADLPELPEDFDLSKRVTASKLIAAIAEYADLQTDFTTVQDIARVSPQNIESGLVVGTVEGRKLLVEYDVQSVFQGIGFSAVHYTMLNRSPADLAESTLSKSVRANTLKSPADRLDADEAQEVANRAAGHALETFVGTQDKLIMDITNQLTSLRGFRDAIRAGGRAHYSGRNLEAMRKTVDTIILTDLEVAYLNRVWQGQGVNLADLRSAVQYNLYGRNGHSNTRLTYWKQYITMAGLHAKRQLAIVKSGLRSTKRELEHFTPYLERGRQQIEDAR
jgi:hypothetical protein